MVKLQDIADRTGYSISLISRVLNGDPTLTIPSSTKDRIISVSQELGYQKRPFKRKHTYHRRKIAIVHWYTAAREMADPYYVSIRIGAEDCLLSRNCEIIRIYQDQMNIDDLLKDVGKIDGLIGIGKFSNSEINHLRKYSDCIVFVDLYTRDPFVHCIRIDFDDALHKAIDYLYQNGHTKIGYLGGREKTSDGMEYPNMRRDAFEKYCDAYHIQYQNWVMEERFSTDSGYSMAKQLLANSELPTAVFCANDQIALGALTCMHDNNIQVPHDLSIMGFNNDNAGTFSSPSLTTINAHPFSMGFMAAVMVADILPARKLSPIIIVQSTDLIIRGTVRNLGE